MRIPGIPEEVEPVTDLDQLRVGASFWMVLCICGGKHRGMVTRLAVESCVHGIQDGVLFGSSSERVVHFQPEVRHHVPGTTHQVNVVVNELSIRKQSIYRVVDPLMDYGDVNEVRRAAKDAIEEATARRLTRADLVTKED